MGGWGTNAHTGKEPNRMTHHNGGARARALKAALPKVLPICISFFFLAMSYGVLMGTRGFSFLWPLCMSALIYTGSMEFVTVNLLVSAFNPFATFLLAVMMGTRHLFYGLSMLGRFKNMGLKKPYLIYAMCDETFAVNSSARIPENVDRGWFYFFVSLLNQVSWVAGATFGGVIGGRITFDTDGLDFVMTALFVVIFVDQWLTTTRKSHMAALTGIVVPAICLSLFGADDFMIPSLIAMLAMFLLLRPYLDDLKEPEIDVADSRQTTTKGADDGADGRHPRKEREA